MSDVLSKREHDQIRDEIIADKLDKLVGVKKPRCFLLGGQPGAGKGRVRKAIEESAAGKGSLVIDPDELRAYHPRYADHVEADADTAANKVHKDAMQWATELRAAAIEKKVNLIIDGTLGNTAAAPGLATEAAEGGYQVEVHVIATSFEVSKQSVRGRFEKAFEACRKDDDAELPRNVPENVQKGAFDGIPESLRALCATGKVSRMRVANRNGESLCDVTSIKNVKKKGATAANTALQAERSREWTGEEIEEYASNGREILKLMQKRIDRIDDKSTNGKKAKEQLVRELEKQQNEMEEVYLAKSKTKVSDEEAGLQRIANTGPTVKKTNWLFGFLGSLFTKKKKTSKKITLENTI